jgi:hypothetical protein
MKARTTCAAGTLAPDGLVPLVPLDPVLGFFAFPTHTHLMTL